MGGKAAYDRRTMPHDGEDPYAGLGLVISFEVYLSNEVSNTKLMNSKNQCDSLNDSGPAPQWLQDQLDDTNLNSLVLLEVIQRDEEVLQPFVSSPSLCFPLVCG